MPALMPTKFKGQITWLGYNPDRQASLRNVTQSEMTATFSGPKGDSRYGLNRPADGRLQQQYPLDAPVKNTRQFCIVSVEELEIIAENMGIDAVNPEWLGANMVIQGLEYFSHIPPSSRLISQDGTGLVIDLENRPCHLPAPIINEDLPDTGGKFKAAAKGLRGATAWVEREGMLRVGDDLFLHIPDQPAWPHLDQARGK